MSSGRAAGRTGTAVSGRQSRPAAGGRPRFHPAKEQQEYGKNRARAEAVRRKKKRQRRAFLGAGLLILALAAGGAGFGLVRWKAGSKKRELAEQGVMAMNVGDYETAITVFDQALEGSGKRIGNFEEDVLFNRAEAEYKQGDFAAALELFEAYREKYGADEAAEREIIFLKSRQ